jgi:predicted nucleic acid-binding protein
MRERPATGEARPWRVFLDTGVIIAGCTRPWGATKAVAILLTQRWHFTLVLGEAVERELTRALLRGETVEAEAVSGWLHRVRQERWPLPSPQDIVQAGPLLLPVLRHQNDLGVVVTAVQARPDFVISANTAHWNAALAARTGLRIMSPNAFLASLIPLLPEV